MNFMFYFINVPFHCYILMLYRDNIIAFFYKNVTLFVLKIFIML